MVTGVGAGSQNLDAQRVAANDARRVSFHKTIILFFFIYYVCTMMFFPRMCKRSSRKYFGNFEILQIVLFLYVSYISSGVRAHRCLSWTFIILRGKLLCTNGKIYNLNVRKIPNRFLMVTVFTNRKHNWWNWNTKKLRRCAMQFMFDSNRTYFEYFQRRIIIMDLVKYYNFDVGKVSNHSWINFGYFIIQLPDLSRFRSCTFFYVSAKM